MKLMKDHNSGGRSVAPPPLSAWYVLCIWLILVCGTTVSAQEKHMVQVKTFDQQLQPFKNIDISINGKDYIAMGNKGVAFIELSDNELPLTSVKIKNEQLEAASWNYSKGIVEIIIRKKNYQLHRLIVKDGSGRAVENLKVTFNGRKPFTSTTKADGRLELPLPLDEKIASTDQFAINDYDIVSLQPSENETVLTVDRIKIEPVAEAPVVKGGQEYFKDFDLSKLDSIQSLTVFYAIFKNYNFNELSPVAKKRVDAKFNELVRKLEAAQAEDVAYIGKISDSSFVRDDINNLLAQARLENTTLDLNREDFDNKVKIISDKLASGIENLDAGTRAKLLSDLALLERLLVDNENQFYKNQNDYRQMLSALKEKFFNFEDLENRLSLSERQRLEEQRVFRQRLFAILSVVFVFAVLIVLLIYFGNKLRKQKKALFKANAEIQSINENLESLVRERTRSLAEANKELDTFLYRASHDLRAPICSIIGLCNLATHIANSDSKVLFEKVGQTAFAMDKLLRKLKIISEINNPSDFSPIALMPLMEGIKSKFNEIINTHRINFVINCDDEIVFYTYPVLIKAILFNLIENAVFYSAIRNYGIPEITLKASVEGDHIQLSIYDNGIGVDPQMSNRLFDMFFKGDEFSKGNGLGLYIVQKSAQALGGNIILESKVGYFTKFVVQLPFKPVQAKSELAVTEDILQEV